LLIQLAVDARTLPSTHTDHRLNTTHINGMSEQMTLAERQQRIREMSRHTFAMLKADEYEDEPFLAPDEKRQQQFPINGEGE
jgi:hypothetical protein